MLLGCAIRLAPMRPGGTNSYGKWPLLDGTTFIDQRFGAAVAYHTPASFSDAFQYAVSGTTVRYIITKPLSIDFIQSFQPADWQARSVQVSDMLDAFHAKSR
ncbi:membrane protein (plasmid) [Ralstonia solanacearum]|nr:membrane protein [Ralstonia solanacearum]